MIRSFKTDIERVVRENSQQRALLDSKTGRVWTYTALFEAMIGFGALLTSTGVRPGDRIFSVLPNGVEQLVAFLAALWCGVDFCPISPLATLDESCKCILASRCVAGLVPYNLNPHIREKLGECTLKKSAISVPLDGDLTRYATRVAAQVDAANAQSGRLLIFTSGTTANPKAVVHDGDRLWSSAMAWSEFHSWLDRDARFYNILPMSYLGGLFNLGLIPFACGGSVVISDPFSGTLALKFWRQIKQNDVNTLWLAPSMIRALVRLYKPSAEIDAARSQVRASFLGMAPIGPSEKERFEDLFGIQLLENFALSETTFLTSKKLGDSPRRHPGSVGKPLPWAEVRLSPLADDPSRSEIEAKTPFLFNGYMDSQGEISRPLTPDGFFRTGDLGVFGEGEVLILKGRWKDVVKKGGYLITLRDIEEVAEGHELVKEAAAIGVPHEFYGETPVLCVELSGGGRLPKEILGELRTLLTKGLAKFKWPGEIVAMESLPRTESGKVQKWVLKDWVESRRAVIDSVSF